MKKRVVNNFLNLDDETKKYIQNGDLIFIGDKDNIIQEDFEEVDEINPDDYIDMPEDEYIVE